MATLLEKRRENCSEKRTIAYLYRPATINPARIFVLYDWELWRKAGIRPIGLVDQVPFATRPMTNEEIEESDNCKYLIHKRYSDWSELVEHEIIFDSLTYYRTNFKLNGKSAAAGAQAAI